MRPALIASMVARQTSASPNVLTPSDFTYLGATQLPVLSSGQGRFGYAATALAGRRVGSDIHLFVQSDAINTAQGGEVVELKYNGVGTANPCTYVTNWGDVTKGQMASYLPYAILVHGLLWDPTLNVLMWCYANTYNTNSNDDPSFGYSSLTGSDNSGVTAYGPWRYENTRSKRTEGYLFHLPSAVQAALGGGKRIAAGAPTSSGNVDCAWGAFATAFTPPASSTPANVADGNSPTDHAITGDTHLIYCDIVTPQYKDSQGSKTCQWTHGTEHDVLVRIDSAHGNAVSCDTAGNATLTAPVPTFTSNMVGNNFYNEGGVGSVGFLGGVFLILSYIDSTRIVLQGNPTGGGGGTGGIGDIGADPRDNPVQDGTGRNINGNLGGALTFDDPNCFGGYGGIAGRFGLDNQMCATWIDGANKQGLVYFAQILQRISGYTYPVDDNPHIWYGPAQVGGATPHKYCVHGHDSAWCGLGTGNGADHMVNVMYIYDPQDILDVVNGVGGKTPLSITQNPASTDAYRLAQIAHGGSAGLQGVYPDVLTDDPGAPFPDLSSALLPSQGCYFDPTSKLLFLMEGSRDGQGAHIPEPVGIVHVFSVNC